MVLLLTEKSPAYRSTVNTASSFQKWGLGGVFSAAFHVLLDSADAALVVLCSSPTKTYKNFYAAAPAGS